MKMYEPGDKIEGVGIVESNHFGLSWPVTKDGYNLYGVVQVRCENGESVFCDAISGEKLSFNECDSRVGDKSFDYDGRFENNRGRRHPNEERVEVIRSWSKARQFWYRESKYWWHSFKKLLSDIRAIGLGLLGR